MLVFLDRSLTILLIRLILSPFRWVWWIRLNVAKESALWVREQRVFQLSGSLLTISPWSLHFLIIFYQKREELIIFVQACAIVWFRNDLLWGWSWNWRAVEIQTRGDWWSAKYLLFVKKLVENRWTHIPIIKSWACFQFFSLISA